MKQKALKKKIKEKLNIVIMNFLQIKLWTEF